MLLIINQIFSSLLGHLPFSVQFFLHFYGVTFFGTPNIDIHWSNLNKYRKGTLDATTSSSLNVPLMMSFDDFLSSKTIIFVVRK